VELGVVAAYIIRYLTVYRRHSCCDPSRCGRILTRRRQSYSYLSESIPVIFSDVKSSRPKWPRGQNFGLGLGLGLKDLASISLSDYVIGHFSSKNRVKFGNFVNFSGNNLKSYVVNHYLVVPFS